MESSFGQLQQSHEFITVCNPDGLYPVCRWNFECCPVVVGRHTGDIMGNALPRDWHTEKVGLSASTSLLCWLTIYLQMSTMETDSRTMSSKVSYG